MRIHVVGGGPAGLYFSILMKARSPGHEICVFERNPRGSTFGWGVVFSGQTLSSLRAADPESHAEIERRFELWDNVDVVHRGEKVSVLGNRFSGIARLELLDLLQRRCQALGVPILYERPVDDPETLADCDLLVGADGVRSAVRERYADVFGPELSLADNRYIWLGTPRLFHGLTLTFREHAGGLFIAHSYKFSPTLSTFIVECDPSTWTSAGLDRLDSTATLAFLREVFAEDLAGEPLLSNQSSWIQFLNVRNRNWFHPRVVLLGDALHTAHFSIGSGTKLALEDAIQLADCLGGASSVEEALRAFGQQRRPFVERYQAVAETSRLWFENARRYLHLDPVRFAFEVMTRSDRVDLENLRARDPEFVRRYLAASGR